MSVVERREDLAISQSRAVTRRLRGPKWFVEMGWRHIVAICACLFGAGLALAQAAALTINPSTPTAAAAISLPTASEPLSATPSTH